MLLPCQTDPGGNNTVRPDRKACGLPTLIGSRQAPIGPDARHLGTPAQFVAAMPGHRYADRGASAIQFGSSACAMVNMSWPVQEGGRRRRRGRRLHLPSPLAAIRPNSAARLRIALLNRSRRTRLSDTHHHLRRHLFGALYRHEAATRPTPHRLQIARHPSHRSC